MIFTVLGYLVLLFLAWAVLDILVFTIAYADASDLSQAQTVLFIASINSCYDPGQDSGPT